MGYFPIRHTLSEWDTDAPHRVDRHRMAYALQAVLAWPNDNDRTLQVSFIDTVDDERLTWQFHRADGRVSDQDFTRHTWLRMSGRPTNGFGGEIRCIQKRELRKALMAGDQLLVLMKLALHHPEYGPSLTNARRVLQLPPDSNRDWNERKSVSHIAAALCLTLELCGSPRNEANRVIEQDPWLIYARSLSFYRFGVTFRSSPHADTTLSEKKTMRLIDIDADEKRRIEHLIRPLKDTELSKLGDA